MIFRRIACAPDLLLAAQRRIPEVAVKRVSGHRSVATLRGYVRAATLFDDAPLATI